MNIDMVATVAAPIDKGVDFLKKKLFSKKMDKLSDSVDVFEDAAKVLKTCPLSPPALQKLGKAMEGAIAKNPGVRAIKNTVHSSFRINMISLLRPCSAHCYSIFWWVVGDDLWR
jgi:hypothetical protein